MRQFFRRLLTGRKRTNRLANPVNAYGTGQYGTAKYN